MAQEGTTAETSGPKSLLQKAHPRAQDRVYTVLGYLQWGRLHTPSLGNLFSAQSLHRKVVPHVQVE